MHRKTCNSPRPHRRCTGSGSEFKSNWRKNRIGPRQNPHAGHSSFAPSHGVPANFEPARGPSPFSTTGLQHTRRCSANQGASGSNFSGKRFAIGRPAFTR